MSHQRSVIAFKIVFALLGFSAIVTEIATIIERHKFVALNFFSFFTIQSNLFAVVMLLIGSIALAQKKNNLPITMLRGASTVYMVTTGIVFAVLLSGLNVELTAAPWDNIVLHYIMPLAVLADWLIDPPLHRINLRQRLIWLGYPAIYVAYSLIRGLAVGWYPYPFLNPTIHGYTYVGVISLAIALLVVTLAWALTRVRLKTSIMRS